jgi:hypothetical protein
MHNTHTRLHDSRVVACCFFLVQDTVTDVPTLLSPRGWLFYRPLSRSKLPSSSNAAERLRRRYFVLRGHELSIYKHALCDDEERESISLTHALSSHHAIRYGVMDLAAVQHVAFGQTHAPENTIELYFETSFSIVMIPPSDASAVSMTCVAIALFWSAVVIVVVIVKA